MEKSGVHNDFIEKLYKGIWWHTPDQPTTIYVILHMYSHKSIGLIDGNTLQPHR